MKNKINYVNFGGIGLITETPLDKTKTHKIKLIDDIVTLVFDIAVIEKYDNNEYRCSYDNLSKPQVDVLVDYFIEIYKDDTQNLTFEVL